MNQQNYSDIKQTLENSPTKTDELCAEITLMLQNANLVILVEGDTDYRLFKKLFLEYKGVFTKSTDSGNSIINSIICKINHSKLIGINDADFKTVLGIDITPRIFRTDTHDIEMLLLSESDVINSIQAEYDIVVNIDEIFEKLKPLTLLKLYQFKNQFSIEFGGIHVGKRNLNNTLSLDCLIKELGKNTNNSLINKDDVQSLANHLDLGFFVMCNGHDVCSIIASQIKKPKLKLETLCSFMRGAYQLNHFKKTKLFESITTYCTENKLIFTDD